MSNLNSFKNMSIKKKNPQEYTISNLSTILQSENTNNSNNNVNNQISVIETYNKYNISVDLIGSPENINKIKQCLDDHL